MSPGVTSMDSDDHEPRPAGMTVGRSCRRTHNCWMVAVDPDDDGVQRYVVRRYANDPLRHERRHQVVAAFDNEQEFRRLLESLSGDLERRRDVGQPIDPREHYTGHRLEPGYRRRQRYGRVLREAIRRRVSISDEFIDRLDLPGNMFVARQSAKEDG